MAEVIHKKPPTERRKGVAGRKTINPFKRREFTFNLCESKEQRKIVADLMSVLEPKSKSELYRFILYKAHEEYFPGKSKILNPQS